MMLPYSIKTSPFQSILLITFKLLFTETFQLGWNVVFIQTTWHTVPKIIWNSALKPVTTGAGCIGFQIPWTGTGMVFMQRFRLFLGQWRRILFTQKLVQLCIFLLSSHRYNVHISSTRKHVLMYSLDLLYKQWSYIFNGLYIRVQWFLTFKMRLIQ